MKRINPPVDDKTTTKKGYNEKNPGQPGGAFPPAAADEKPQHDRKSNTADKKSKEDKS